MKTLDNINLDKPSGNYETVLTPTEQVSAGVKAILEIFEEQGVPKYKVDNIAKLFGSVLKVAGVEQGVVEFASDPQQQLDTLESDIATLDADKATNESVALNTEAITRLDGNKQNKLPQNDLDNIAMLNQLPDKLDAKQNKLSAQQIANIDDVPNKATKSFGKLGESVSVSFDYDSSTKFQKYTNTYDVPIRLSIWGGVSTTSGILTYTIDNKELSTPMNSPAENPTDNAQFVINEVLYPNQTIIIKPSSDSLVFPNAYKIIL